MASSNGCLSCFVVIGGTTDSAAKSLPSFSCWDSSAGPLWVLCFVGTSFCSNDIIIAVFPRSGQWLPSLKVAQQMSWRSNPGTVWWWGNIVDAGKNKADSSKHGVLCSVFSVVVLVSPFSSPAKQLYPQYIISCGKCKWIHTLQCNVCTVCVYVCVCPWSSCKKQSY